MDVDLRSIFQCLSDTLRDFRVAGVSGFAFQMDLYKAYCSYVFNHSITPPKFIVVELNLRSFSPEWDLRPEYQFEYEKIILENTFLAQFYHPLSVFKYFQRDISQESFVNSYVNIDGKTVGKVNDFLKSETINEEYLKNQFLFHYLYKLDKNHRKVRAMIEIIEMASNHGSKVLFYVTPIDYNKGEHFFPKEFDKILTSHISFFHNLLTEHGAYFLDLSNSIPENYFSYGQTPEHLKQQGRQFVASKIALEVNKISTKETIFSLNR
jgi:hypothetical protein